MDKTGFIKYLEGKDFAVKTISNYVKYVGEFLAKTKKEDIQIVKPDVLKFLEYLKNTRKVQNAYRSFYLVALNHYFTFLYQTEKIAKNPCLFLKIRGIKRKTLYKIYTPEEMEELFDAYYQLFIRNYDGSHMPKNSQRQSKLSKERNALILSILINQGTTTGEIEKIELSDIDLIKATIKIRSARRGDIRTLPLKATQIGLFMNYLQKIRPQLSEKDGNKLFTSTLYRNGKQRKTKENDINYAFFALTTTLKSIDKQFVNVLQLRASVISFWIKTQGLRKAQYLAGHRYICTTERYVTNNLDGLIDDINKLHPFDF
jgi:site-specific recombinase XerD